MAHLVHGMRGPVLWVSQVQDVLPVLQVGDDLEGLGHLRVRQGENNQVKHAESVTHGSGALLERDAGEVVQAGWLQW